MSDVFISYSRKDADVASRLLERLKNDHASVFMDQTSLVAGEDFSKITQQQLKDAKIVLVILSENSVRSGWVQEELRYALNAGESKRIIPILLDESAKDNWVWPLVANRQPKSIRFEHIDRDIKEIVDDLTSLNRHSRRLRLATWVAFLLAILSLAFTCLSFFR